MGQDKKRSGVREAWRAAVDALESLLRRKELDWVPIPIGERGRRRRRADRSGG